MIWWFKNANIMTQSLALFGETQKTVGEWQENGDEWFEVSGS